MTLGITGCDDKSEKPIDSNKKRFAFIVGIDGMQVKSFETAWTPTIDKLAAEGSSTTDCMTQLEAATRSGPGWHSILLGV